MKPEAAESKIDATAEQLAQLLGEVASVKVKLDHITSATDDIKSTTDVIKSSTDDIKSSTDDIHVRDV